MTMQLILQAFIAPLLLVLAASAKQQLQPVVVAIGIAFIISWVEGWGLAAMDSVWLAFLVSSAVVLFARAFPKPLVWAVQTLVLAALSVWQVKNFASSLPASSWLIQGGVLIAVTAMPMWLAARQVQPQLILGKWDISQLFWLTPAIFIACVSPIAGSLMIGQIAGLLALTGGLIWLVSPWRNAVTEWFGYWWAVPTLFIGQMAWHYAEIPWTTLLIGLIGWLPLFFIPTLNKFPAYVPLIKWVTLTGLLVAVGLWLEWPEQSLY